MFNTLGYTAKVKVDVLTPHSPGLNLDRLSELQLVGVEPKQRRGPVADAKLIVDLCLGYRNGWLTIRDGQ